MRSAAFLTAALAAGLLLAAGCGEKIAIPEAEGIFGLREYSVYVTVTEDDPRQLVYVQGTVFVVTADALVRRDVFFEETGRVDGLADPRSLCYEPDSNRIHVWEQGAQTVRTYSRDLELLATNVLPDVTSVTAMTTSPRGADEDPDAVNFLYLADPEAGAVHRYAIDPYGNLLATGLLAADRGTGVRDVKRPYGLARDWDDHVLVCDTDSLRHWIIRFDPTPDQDDADLRGTAALFLPYEQCAPVPAASEYVIGNAPACGQTDWVPGASDSLGVFNTPSAVAVAGAGRIYVVDTRNDRMQIFNALGEYEQAFGDADMTPAPASIDAYDFKYGAGSTDYYYGALVFSILPETSQLRSYISAEYNEFINRQPRPPE
jgi:hypothetical protein